MSSLSYQSPDASQNVEQKRGNIASFFKTGAKAAKACGSTSAPQASAQAGQGTAASAKDAHQARLDAPSASESATGAHGHPGKQDDSPDGGIGKRSQPPSEHHSAGVDTEPKVAKLEDNPVAKEEPAEGDVLNTDDAGGIGALQLPHVYVCFVNQPKARGIKVTR